MRAGLRGEDRWFVEDHITREVRDDDHEAYRLLGEGQTYADLPARLQRYRTDIFTDKYKRLSRDEPGRSITAHIAKDGYWYIHPTQHRTLSIREAARVQSFPDDFRFAGQPTHRFRQIGNAVPPLLAEAIAEPLRRALADPAVAVPIGGGGEIRGELLAWRAGRPQHPWRTGDADPWRVIVAELCLSRIPAARAAGVCGALWRIAPDPATVVAEPERVREGLSGLGIRLRAESVIDAAEAIEDELGGTIPMDFMALRCIPGVGDHLAQAVLSFAGGRIIPLLDSGSARVVGRLVGNETGGRWQLRPDLHRLAGDGGTDADFNEALIELGQVVCTPSEPGCDLCPLSGACAHAGDRSPARQLDLGTAA
jgi:DNA (cytosine-5)-methyltransferase 1